nr:copia protein [Tanacetum cinerariifolium]
SGPTWLFDIDSLTRTMNYQLVTARNQTNPSTRFQDKFTTEKAGEKIDQQYVLFPMWASGFINPQNNDRDAGFDGKEPDINTKKPEFEVNDSSSSSAQSRKQDDKTKKKAKGKSHVESFIGYKDLSTEFEDCSDNNINEVNAAELKDITYSDDKDDVGAEDDFNNLETSITEEPKKKVWVLVDLPHRKRAIGTKWVFRNKKNKRGIVIKNKARLVAQRHIQEEGINYEEVFAPLARIEAIILFLAYATFMGFMVYQMDVKSAFLYGTIEEEVYVCQPLEKPLLKDPDGEDIDVHTYSDSPILRVNTPRSDEDRLELIELTVFLLPTVEKSGIEVHAVDLQVSAVRHNLLLFSLTKWYCSLSAVRLQVLVNMKKVVATEATIREALRLDDAEGVDCLPNEEISVELARMGYEKPYTKLTFYKAFFSSQKVPVVDYEIIEMNNKHYYKIIRANDHTNKVLSMQEDEIEPAEVQEVVDVVTTAKLITEVVTTASETVTATGTIITIAEAQVPAATFSAAPARVAAAPSRRRKRVDKGKGILVEELKPLKKKQLIEQDEQYARELHAELYKDIYLDEAIDHIKRKAKEDPVVKRYQVLKRKPQTEAQAIKNIMMYLKNVASLKIEDLEALWSLVKERFSTTKPKNFSDDFLLVTLRAMFKKPNIHAQIWKNQRTVHGPAKVKGWKLLESCGVQIITFTST